MPVPGGEITTTEILVPEVVPPVEETEEDDGTLLYESIFKPDINILVAFRNYENYKILKHVCDKLNNKGINFMITLNKHPKLKELFKEYNIKKFKKKYSGMSNGKFDEYEMIITNY